MSLKDEVDKLVAAERETLEKQAIGLRTYREKEKAHFLTLRAVLEEMIKAVDPAYLQVRFEDKQATIEVKNPKSSKSELRWLILSGWVEDMPDEAELLDEYCIFVVVEYRRTLWYSDEWVDTNYRFKTPAEVLQHLLERIPQKIARYQHDAGGSVR